MKRYLVSFCNSGGSAKLAVVSERQIEQEVVLTKEALGLTAIFGATGIAALSGHYFVALQAPQPTVVELDSDFNRVASFLVAPLADLHGLTACEDGLAIASSGTNQIAFWKPGKPLQIFWQDGGPLCNRLHINDLAATPSGLLACMHGERLPDQMRNGRIVPISNQIHDRWRPSFDNKKALVSGLREPHSISLLDDALYTLESATGDLLECRTGFSPRRITSIVGYPRGLVADADGFVIGCSGYRDISRGMVGDQRRVPLVKDESVIHPLSGSAVFFLNRDGSRRSMVTTSSCGHEIYQILPLPT